MTKTKQPHDPRQPTRVIEMKFPKSSKSTAPPSSPKQSTTAMASNTLSPSPSLSLPSLSLPSLPLRLSLCLRPVSGLMAIALSLCWALLSLTNCKEPPTTHKQLLYLLNQPMPEARKLALLERLGRQSTHAAAIAPALGKELDAPSPRVRKAAFAALLQLGPHTQALLVMMRAISSPHPAIRRFANQTLAEHQSHSNHAIRQGLYHQDPRVRLGAMRLLCRRQKLTPPQLRDISQQLRDPNATIQGNAILCALRHRPINGPLVDAIAQSWKALPTGLSTQIARMIQPHLGRVLYHTIRGLKPTTKQTHTPSRRAAYATLIARLTRISTTHSHTSSLHFNTKAPQTPTTPKAKREKAHIHPPWHPHNRVMPRRHGQPVTRAYHDTLLWYLPANIHQSQQSRLRNLVSQVWPALLNALDDRSALVRQAALTACETLHHANIQHPMYPQALHKRLQDPNPTIRSISQQHIAKMRKTWLSPPTTPIPSTRPTRPTRPIISKPSITPKPSIPPTSAPSTTQPTSRQRQPTKAHRLSQRTTRSQAPQRQTGEQLRRQPGFNWLSDRMLLSVLRQTPALLPRLCKDRDGHVRHLALRMWGAWLRAHHPYPLRRRKQEDLRRGRLYTRVLPLHVTPLSSRQQRQARQVLRRALRDSEGKVRRVAFWLWRQIQAKEGWLSTAWHLLRDPDAPLRYDAFHALRLHAPVSRLWQRALRLTRDPDPPLRYDALVYALRTSPDQHLLPALLHASQDPSPALRQVSARHLHRFIPSHQSATTALTKLCNDRNARVKQSALYQWGLLFPQDPKVYQRLLSGILASDRRIRLTALRLLRLRYRMWLPQTVRWLGEQSQSQDPNRRIQALLAMQTLHTILAVPHLRRAQEDPDRRVQRIAHMVLKSYGTLAESAGIPALCTQIDAAHGAAKIPLLMQLRRSIAHNWQPAIPVLQRALADPNHKVRVAALHALKPLGTRGLIMYKQMRQDPHPQVRITIAQRLGELGMFARHLLHTMLRDQDPQVRKAAKRAFHHRKQ